MEAGIAVVLARLVGGVGLFLLGMHLMTDGLTLAAGRTLREILSRWTGTRLRGLASGILVTSLVQSSSAVTVATIGFVNAGLLSLAQAIAVIYGSNVGTTATGWLVAAVGLHVDLKAFALPLVGVGMLMRLFGRNRRVAPLGEALAGFGLFFLGIDALKGGFETLGGPRLDGLVDGGVLQVLTYVGVGFLLTLVLQSSSAAIALILTATAGDAVPLGTGAALVIGANVGTTSTAALAVLGATANARRVAAGHVVFNLLTGLVALLLLPLLLALIVQGRTVLRLEAEPAAVLAAFHTVFNVLGVALLLPLTPRLVVFLEGRFRTPEEDEALPRYLDRNVAATPVLAVHAIVLELTRVGAISRRMSRSAVLGDAPALKLARERETLDRLVDQAGAFAAETQRRQMPPELGDALPAALRVARHYSEVAELAHDLAERRPALPKLALPEAAAAVSRFQRVVAELADAAGLEREDYTAEACAQRLEDVDGGYREVRDLMLRAGAQGNVPVRDVVEHLDWLSNARRLARQLERGTRFLADVGALTALEPSRAKPPAA